MVESERDPIAESPASGHGRAMSEDAAKTTAPSGPGVTPMASSDPVGRSPSPRSPFGSPRKNDASNRSQWLRPWWLTFLLLLAANWFLMRVFSPEPAYINIPYTSFKQQVEAGNVKDVTSQGDAIQGTFVHAVTYPPPTKAAAPQPTPAVAPSWFAAEEQHPRTSTQFRTQLPAFASVNSS